MESEEKKYKNKGGRPKKAIRRNKVLTLKCASYEQARISTNAKKAMMSVSEFLRTMGLNGKVIVNKKVLPAEVLSFTAVLNHLAANLNQIAKKRNSIWDELNAAERASLHFLSGELKQIALSIKNYLQ